MTANKERDSQDWLARDWLSEEISQVIVYLSVLRKTILILNLMCSFNCVSEHHMSHVARKPVFGVSNQVQHKPGCTATEEGARDTAHMIANKDTQYWMEVLLKVKSMQRSGTEAIRTQIQSSKPKREITNIYTPRKLCLWEGILFSRPPSEQTTDRPTQCVSVTFCFLNNFKNH